MKIAVGTSGVHPFKDTASSLGTGRTLSFSLEKVNNQSDHSQSPMFPYLVPNLTAQCSSSWLPTGQTAKPVQQFLPPPVSWVFPFFSTADLSPLRIPRWSPVHTTFPNCNKMAILNHPSTWHTTQAPCHTVDSSRVLVCVGHVLTGPWFTACPP
jgi:hypothetical protein